MRFPLLFGCLTLELSGGEAVRLDDWLGPATIKPTPDDHTKAHADDGSREDSWKNKVARQRTGGKANETVDGYTTTGREKANTVSAVLCHSSLLSLRFLQEYVSD
jgi:hypothetical protein